MNDFFTRLNNDKKLIIAITIIVLIFLLILIILLKLIATITTRVLCVIMIIHDINDDMIMKHDRRGCNNEMNVSKRCLNECANNMYNFNCYKNIMVLKEIKSNEEPLPDAGRAYIPLDHVTCLPL